MLLSGSALVAAVRLLPSAPYQRVTYRAIRLERLFGFHDPNGPYPPAPLYTQGPRHSGARFTPVGGAAMLYLAQTPHTAFAEANYPARVVSRALRPRSGLPWPTVLVAVRVRLDRLLDLCDSQVQTALSTSRAELTGEWRLRSQHGHIAPTQELGQAVHLSGQFDGLRFPSARDSRGACLAVFPDHLVGSAYVEVWDPDQNLNDRLP